MLNICSKMTPWADPLWSTQNCNFWSGWWMRQWPLLRVYAIVYSLIWYDSYCLYQASTDEDRLRTVQPPLRPCGQRTGIWAQTVHLMDKFGRWTKIIIWRWRIFDHEPSTSLTEKDDRPWLFVLDGRRWTVDEDRPSISRTDSDDEPLKYKNVDGGGRADRLTKLRQ